MNQRIKKEKSVCLLWIIMNKTTTHILNQCLVIFDLLMLILIPEASSLH